MKKFLLLLIILLNLMGIIISAICVFGTEPSLRLVISLLGTGGLSLIAIATLWLDIKFTERANAVNFWDVSFGPVDLDSYTKIPFWERREFQSRIMILSLILYIAFMIIGIIKLPF